MSVNPATASAAPQIAGAIRQASNSTGISFEYLVTTAQIESNLNPSAQASTSSAKGLYQFIEQTWLGTMKQEGPALGLGQYADAISRSADGRYDVADPNMRTAIMRLRSDPATSAMLAGAFTRANANQLGAAIGRAPTDGELYIAHFLGPDGAGKMINAAANHPHANAAAMFPQAAAANPSIFNDKSGHARSVSEVYSKLTGRFEVARAVSFGPGGPVVASANLPMPVNAPARVAMLAPPLPPLPPRPVPDTAGMTQALAAADTRPPAQQAREVFHSMFSDGPRQGVTQTVSSLWSSGKAEQAAAVTSRGLDLFSDSPSDIRGLFRRSV